MQEELKFSIRYENQYGYIGYNPANCSISVQLADKEKCSEVQEYLNKEQVIPICRNSVGDFVNNAVIAKTGINELKTALTRLWNVTGVSVDWSRPVDIK